MELERILNLFNSMPDSIVGEEVNVICPECGGSAKAVRHDYNEHFFAHCTECEFMVALSKTSTSEDL